jgi:F0F1-type ATP synthase delta subunit
MKIQDIKKLAHHTIVDGTVNSKVAEYVLKNLLRADVKSYLFYLKQEISKRTVYVTSAQTLEEVDQKQIATLFADRDIKFETNEKLGGGLVIRTNDTIMDASLKGTIEATIEKLRN